MSSQTIRTIAIASAAGLAWLALDMRAASRVITELKCPPAPAIAADPEMNCTELDGRGGFRYFLCYKPRGPKHAHR